MIFLAWILHRFSYFSVFTRERLLVISKRPINNANTISYDKKNHVVLLEIIEMISMRRKFVIKIRKIAYILKQGRPTQMILRSTVKYVL